MKQTKSGKMYNLRDMRAASQQKDVDGWYGRRKNGTPYLKRFQGGSIRFAGGPRLNKLLKEHAWLEAYVAKEQEST